MSDPRTAAGAAFPATRWSVVLEARRPGDEAGRHAALAEWCRLYWYPLYAHARRAGWPPEDAEDLTQTFFGRVLADDLFARTRLGAGRLRTFLLVAFGHDLADARRSAGRRKRGGGASLVSLDRDLAEDRFQAEPALQTAPAAEFDRRWARSVLSASIERLAGEYAAGGRSRQFAALRPFLDLEDGAGDDNYDTASVRLGVTLVAARQAVHRLRTRFRRALRTHIADTLAVATETEVDVELAELRAALAA